MRKLGYFSTWTSIKDMPLDNWASVNETGDLRHMYKKYRASYIPTMKDLDNWFTLQDQKIKEFGHPGEYKDYIEQRKEYALLLCGYLETGNRSFKTEAAILEGDIEGLFNKGESVKTRKIVGYLIKHFGTPLKMSKLTVYEYYNLVDTMQDYGKAD
jgi:hypothetical protein